MWEPAEATAHGSVNHGDPRRRSADSDANSAPPPREPRLDAIERLRRASSLSCSGAMVSLLPAGWSAWTIPANAFLCAMGCSLLIHALSQRRGMGTETIVLLGIALVFTFNAALAALEFIASEQALAAVVFWTMGSLGRTTWPNANSISKVFRYSLSATSFSRLGGSWSRYMTGAFFASSALAAATLAAIM